jgi:prophage regulatory protein
MVTATKILRLPEVRTRTAKSRSTIYKGINDGTFPAPIKIGPRAVGWIEAEIEGYIQSCIDASRPRESEPSSDQQ